MKNILRAVFVLVVVLISISTTVNAQFCANERVHYNQIDIGPGYINVEPISIMGIDFVNGWCDLSTSIWNIGINNAVYSFSHEDFEGNKMPGAVNITVEYYSASINTSFSNVSTATNPITLSGAPNGGTFSGIGVINGKFDPAAAGVGTHTIYYSAPSLYGCDWDDQLTVNVTQAVTVRNFPDEILCENVGTYTFSATPTGGTYSGPGVSGNTFNPRSAGGGVHSITYTVSGVSAVARFDVTAIEQVYLTLPVSSLTTADSPITLSGGTPSGGTYSGTGVSGTTFDPAAAGEGIHTISYTITSGSCTEIATDNISVTEASFNIPPQAFCDGESLSMTENGGAYYYNNNPISSTFTSSVFGGAGTYTVVWKRTGYSDAAFQVTVISLPTISFSGASFCQGDGNINLSSYASPSGGTFSGTGVIGTTFNANGTAGSYSISYEYDNGSCSNTEYATFSITEKPTSKLILNPTSVYQDDPGFPLSGGTPLGGTYYVDGVRQTTFNPGNYSVGNYSVTYMVGNGSCTDTDSKTIRVLALGSISYSDRHLCVTDAALTLDDNGGTFTIGGSVLSNDRFDPGSFGVGTYTVTWRRSGYSDETFTITVHAQPSVSLSALPDVCVSSSSLSLSSYASPSGGSFSGTGVSGSSFNPSTAGAGTHTIRYSVSDSYCSNSTTRNISVYGPTTVSLNAPNVTYTDDSPVSLLSYGSPSGGTFKVNGTTTNTLNPSTLGAGTHTITYAYTNAGGCVTTESTSVTLSEKSSYVFDNISACTGDADINLSNNGGTYTINGTDIGTTFSPSTYGAGSYTVNWTKPGSVDASFTISVYTTPTVNTSLVAEQCYKGQSIALLDYVTPGTGTFSGPGVNGTAFNPTSAGTGTHRITYTATNNVCYTEKTLNIEVSGVPSLEISGVDAYCSDAPFVDLSTHVNHSGGAFYCSGGAIGGTRLYPDQLSAGTHTLYYYLNEGSSCEQVDSVNLVIMDPPQVSLTDFDSVYVDEAAFPLTGGMPLGGQYRVDNVLSNTFNPSMSGIGLHTIDYSYSNLLCSNTVQKTIRVLSLQTNSFADRVICMSQPALSLTENGGTFTIDGSPLPGGVFDPQDWGAGIWEVSWSKANFSDAKFTLTVYENPEIFFDDMEMCLYDPSVLLTDYFGGLDLTAEKSATASTALTYVAVGTGIRDFTTFDPQLAGPGAHEITITASDEHCFTEKVVTITVHGVENLAFSGLNGLCSTDAPVDLTSFINHSGGTFSCVDGGINGTSLYPEQLSEGSHTVEYTVQLEGNCSQSVSQDIYVMLPPVVSLPSISDVYVDQPAFSLYGGTPSGGQYYLNGILTDVFDPSTAGVGTHTIRYVYANTLCESFSEVSINVLPLVANFSDRTLCYNSNILEFPDDGGDYFINGVNINGRFDPSIYGIGTFTLTWKKENFEDTSFDITVVPNPEISFSPIGTVCANSGRIDLNNYVYPLGGTFSGKGIEQNQYFNPSTGSGSYEVLYSMAENGCITQRSQTIFVDTDVNLTFNSPSVLCSDAAKIDLNDYVNVQGCSFTSSSQGVINNFLYPELMENGKFDITATYNSESCAYSVTRSIFIVEPDEVYITGLNASYNENDRPFFLTGGTPEGGTYAIDGVNRSIFDPQTLGVGIHTVTYSYSSVNGCENTVRKSVTINEPGVDYFADKTMCYGEKLYLPEHGGTFFINSAEIENGILDSRSFGSGVYTVTWKKQGFADTSFTLSIYDVPAVMTVAIPAQCSDNAPIDLTHFVEPKTGSFSGPGLERSSLFNPSIAGQGEYSILYTLKNEHCYSETTLSIDVNELSDIEFSGLALVCQNQSPVDMRQFVSPSGGKFSCADGGVVDNTLYPSILPAGGHKIIYTVESAGCIKTEEQQMYIIKADSIVLDKREFEHIYANSSAVYLDIATPKGGTYYVNGVQTNIFDPQLLGQGIHAIEYFLENNNGCPSSSSFTVMVHGSKLSNYNDRVICQNAAPLEFDLAGGEIFVDDAQLPSGTFDPTAHEPGVYYGKWTKQGFADTEFTITVREAPEITLFSIPILCPNDEAINLYDYVFPKTGTFSGLALKGGAYFDPGQYQGGTYTIAYTLQAGSCIDIKEMKLRVQGSENVVFEGLPYTICSGSDPLDLMEYVYPKTGHFSNDEGAVISDVLYPSMLSTGIHTLVYTIPNNQGCDQVVNKRIYMLEQEAVSLEIEADICQGAAPYILTGGHPLGGDYYVDGKQVFVFDPSAYVQGVHTLEYRYSNMYGCQSSVSRHFSIIESDKVNLQVPEILCDNGDAIMLKGGYPYGGQYAINGKYMDSFDPKVYGQGEYVLSYEYSNGKCSITKSQPLEVVQAAPVTIHDMEDLCNNALPVKLYGGSPSGGYYTVDGQSVSVLDPSDFTAGTHTLSYNVEQNGCISNASTIFRIYETEDFSVNIPSVCENDDVFTLGVVSPSGGYYSGPGVVNNQLDPSAIGAGTYYYEYTYKSGNGCVSVISFTLTIHAAPQIEMPEINSVCANATAFTLSASPTGGEFTGNGVVNNVYYPSMASSGIQNITYTVKNKYGCSAAKSHSILIKEPKELVMEDINGICQGGEPVELNFVSPGGGHYSGTAIIDNVFYPEKATPGVKTITYNYTDRNGCESELQSKVRVREKPDMQDFYLDAFCTNDEPMELNTEMFYTKSVYMGKGVNNNSFDPELSGPGESIIRYLVVDEHGCSNYNEKSIKVKEAPFVFLQSQSYCQGESAIALQGGYPTGGTYTGSFVLNNSFMPVTTGVYDIRYNYTGDNGCSENTTGYVSVNEVPDVVMDVIPNLCVNSEPLLLTGAAPSGGRYYLNEKENDPITEFNPSVYGVGTYTLNYSYANKAGCSGSTSRTFQVMDTEEVSILDMSSQYCKSADAFSLSQKGYPGGGAFRLNGDMVNTFEPAHLNTGMNTLSYTYESSSGCSVTTSKSVLIATVPPSPILDLKPVYCPGDRITIEPTNYLEEYNIVVQVPGAELTKVEMGRTSFSAQEVSTIDVYYESALGCLSKSRTYEVEVESRNPSFVTETQNIEKGEALQIIALDNYDYITDYVWTFSDGGMSYEPQPYHYFNIQGKNSFYLDYTTTAGCIFSKEWTDYLWVNNSDGLLTAIDDKASAQMKVYPNPAVRELNIVPGQLSEYTIAIFSKNGGLLRLVPDQFGEKQIDVSELAPGAYSIRLIFQDKAASKIFIKQ